MIIQTAPAGEPRLAVMMYEHTALSGQFARAFGNDRFEPVWPNDLMFYVVSHHDAGWAEFDRDPVTDETTGLPYNLVETPAKYLTVTSRRSPDFNERHHPYCGLLEARLDRQNSAGGSALGRADARWRDRSAEQAESSDR